MCKSLCFYPLNQSSKYFIFQQTLWLLPSLLILVSVINIRRGVKTIRLTDFVKLPRGGELLVIETIQNYTCIFNLSRQTIGHRNLSTGASVRQQAARSAGAVTMNHRKIGERRTNKIQNEAQKGRYIYVYYLDFNNMIYM